MIALLLLVFALVLLAAGVIGLLGAPIPVNGWYCLLAGVILLIVWAVVFHGSPTTATAPQWASISLNPADCINAPTRIGGPAPRYAMCIDTAPGCHGYYYYVPQYGGYKQVGAC